MTSKLIVNELAADTGISTITVGDNMSGVTFKTGTSNLHNVGIEIAGINVLGADTPIGAGATIYNSGAAVFTGVVTATSFVGGLPITSGADNRVITASSASAIQGETNLTYDGTNMLVNGTMLNAVQLKFGNSGTAYIDHNIVGQDLQFRVGNSSALDKTALHIDSTGKIGIGTVTPGKQLHVYKSNEHPLLLERGDSANTQVELRTGGAIRGYWGCSTTSNFMVYDNDTSHINFTVLQTGKVGINESSPDTDLHIKNTNPAIILEGTNNSGRQHKIWSSGGNSESLQFSSGNLLYNGDTHRFRAANESTEYLRINSDGEIGINQTDPQAFLHIGNYESTQNINQSTVTQYFIDSTKSLKIARCNRGSITSNAAWYDVAVLAMAGYSYRCQVSIGGNFTQDVVEINVQTSYDSALGNKYSLQISAKSASAHSVDRITQVRVAKKGSDHYLQVYIATGVDANTNGKSVLETTCGIYAQNGADNAYPMFAAASGSYTNCCHTFPDFGVHAAWDFTSNSSGVRSYTAWTGGGQNYLTAENAGNGSSHGTVARFTAPMRGLYQVNFMVKAINAAIDNDCLINMYGSMTYNAQNPWGVNSEVYDPRGAATGAQGQQGEGNSWIMRMAAGDYFSFDYYRAAPTGYIDGGGQIFTVSLFKINS